MPKENDIVFDSLDNCWLALCRRMRANHTAETQRTMNLLGRIISTAKSETIKRREEAKQQITIEEWLVFFEEENK